MILVVSQPDLFCFACLSSLFQSVILADVFDLFCVFYSSDELPLSLVESHPSHSARIIGTEPSILRIRKVRRLAEIR